MLKPQDVLVSLLLAVHPEARRTYVGLAKRAGLSLSEAHASTLRARKAGLARRTEDEIAGRAVLQARPDSLLEFLVHGIRYVFVPDRGEVTRGIPTAHAAPPLNALVSSATTPVWPSPTGTTRGESFQPLYPSVLAMSRRDPQMYEVLALVDALRGGRARERALAADLLKQKLVTRA